MSKWIIKAIVQKIISFLPFRNRINFFFQKYVTKGVRLSDEYFIDRLEHAIHHLESYRSQKNSIPDSSLELGTGWYPVVPVYNFLVGVEQIFTLDLNRYMNRSRLQDCLAKFIANKELLNEKSRVETLTERWILVEELVNDRSVSLDQMLGKLNLKYLVGDARSVGLESNSIDLIHSNNTFEHVNEGVLFDILSEFKRLLKPNGLMSHFIDLSDHFAHFDNSITIYNFLRYSKRKWKRIDNSIQPQNRLRWKDYLAIYQDLNIPVTNTEVRPGNAELVNGLNIHEEFAAYTAEELAISHGYLISKK